MQTRDSSLLALRGDSLGELKSAISLEEAFQNNTLRPILKLQNDLLINLFIDYIKQQKNTFYSLNLDKKLAYIENAIQRDNSLRNVLKGITIGLFTTDEYTEYLKNSSNLNKRMMGLVGERLKSQIQLLEQHQ
jgi:hypothetical protein